MTNSVEVTRIGGVRRIDGIALRVELPVVTAGFLLMLRAIVMRLAERLEIAPLEREIGMRANRQHMVDDVGGREETDREAEAAPGFFGEDDRGETITPGPEVVDAAAHGPYV